MDRQSWLAGQREALTAALNGAPLATSLGALVATAKQRFGPGVQAAFCLADARREALHHVVGMSAEYAALVDGFPIGPDSMACGLATYTGVPVLTNDVTRDPRWQPWLSAAEKFHIRGSWSFPICTETGIYVGSFSVYLAEPREATPLDLELAALLAQTAAIIISRHMDMEVRREAEEALRASRHQLEAELADSRLLQRLSAELVREGSTNAQGTVRSTCIRVSAHARPRHCCPAKARSWA
jgi:GAF domain-containing protein